MLYKVSLNFFADGYSVTSGGGCIDLPVGVVAGNFSPNFYKYYLAFQITQKNWGHSIQEWSKESNASLNKIGLQLNTIKTDTWYNVLSTIIESVNQGKPVLLPLSYHKLFYYLDYNKHGSHMLMVTGYDQERNLLLITDCNIVEHGLKLLNKDYTLYQLPLTFDIMKDIWEGSQLYFAENEPIFAYRVYNVAQTIKLLPPLNIIEIISSFLSRNRSALLEFIDTLINTNINNMELNRFLNIRRIAFYQLTVLFDTIESELKENEQKLKLRTFKKEFLHSREIIINRLQVNYSKKMTLSVQEANFLSESISQKEHELFNIIHDLS